MASFVIRAIEKVRRWATQEADEGAETSLLRERLVDGGRTISTLPTSKYGGSQAAYGGRSINYGYFGPNGNSARVTFSAKTVTLAVIMPIGPIW